MSDLDVSSLDWADRARFWSKVNVTRVSKCWPWRGHKNSLGYGAIKIQGRSHGAHRVAYGIAANEMPPDKVVRHKCDNPECCNPTHLIVGTHADNVADRVRRQRSAAGERAGRAKLTERQVLSIADDSRTAKELAEVHSVSVGTIQSIKQKRIWRHLWGET